MNKLNDICSEIVHIAIQAFLSDDEAVKRVALGDIYHAIACVLPVDRAPAPAARRTFPDRCMVKNCINYADGYVYSVEKQGRKLVGVVDYVDQEWRGTVYDGEEVILEVVSVGKGKNFVTEAMRAAMFGSIMYLTHMRRHRQNRKAKLAAAALSSKAELVEAVGQQQDDDDLALRLENA